MDVFAERVHEHGRIESLTLHGKVCRIDFKKQFVVPIRTRAKAMRKSLGKRHHRALSRQNLESPLNHPAKNFWRGAFLEQPRGVCPATALDNGFTIPRLGPRFRLCETTGKFEPPGNFIQPSLNRLGSGTVKSSQSPRPSSHSQRRRKLSGASKEESLTAFLQRLFSTHPTHNLRGVEF